MMSYLAGYTQDVGINADGLIMDENAEGQVRIVIGNYNGGTTKVQVNKVCPQISIPTNLCTITGAVLPTGWAVCYIDNEVGTIVLSNGTDEMEPWDEKEIFINITAKPQTVETSGIITCNIGWAKGGISADGCDNTWGPTPLNMTGNDNSTNTLIVRKSDILPITVTSFTAQKEKDNNAIVKWTVTDAKNFSHFELERSADGKTFIKVSAQAYDAKKPAYSYVDQNLVPGVYQYRLNMVDIDGSQKHSATKEVKIEKTANMTITPNPARDVVYVRGAKEGSVIRIMDIKGGLVQELRLTNASMPVNVAKLAPAAYVVQVIESGNVAGTMQMIKQ